LLRKVHNGRQKSLGDFRLVVSQLSSLTFLANVARALAFFCGSSLLVLHEQVNALTAKLAKKTCQDREDRRAVLA